MIATQPEGRHLLPEERLWKAVLWRAFDDCTYGGYERTLIVAKNEAILWFKKRTQDFIDVCSFSSFDPGYIYFNYKKLWKTKKIKYELHQTKYLRQREKYLNDRRRQQRLQSSD
tara:strand:- start:119 stop:460 length:342 start_codon:yes stop_codon:yes gene_type:complete